MWAFSCKVNKKILFGYLIYLYSCSLFWIFEYPLFCSDSIHLAYNIGKGIQSLNNFLIAWTCVNLFNMQCMISNLESLMAIQLRKDEINSKEENLKGIKIWFWWKCIIEKFHICIWPEKFYTCNKSQNFFFAFIH